jgi:hypothetical protein
MPRYIIERCRKVWDFVAVEAESQEAAFDVLFVDTEWEEFDDEVIDLRIELVD